MNRPNDNSLGLLAVIAAGMFVLALVYHMLIGGRGFLAAVFFALIFALIIAALIYLFLMTSIGMEWSQSARRKIEEKAGEAKTKIEETRASTDAESDAATTADADSSESRSDAVAAAEPAAEEATAADTAQVAREPEPVAEEAPAARVAPEQAAAAPADIAQSESTRVEPTRVAPSRIIEPKPAEPTPVESTPDEPTTEEAPKVAPTRVHSRRVEPSESSPPTDMSEDYDRDGVLEGTNEGSQPSRLDAPRGGNADDLKMIKGVGPKLEKLLNSLGFWHFDQVASWSDDEVAWVNANLPGFPGRVSRDNWVEQAKTLAGGGETEFSKRVEGGDVY